MEHAHSSELFARAQRVIPGGVNSPVRAFRSVGTDPVFYDRAKGSRVWDVDGNEYIDFVASWGPMILGHAPDVVLDAVREQLDRGTSYGAPAEVEVLAASLFTCVDTAVSAMAKRLDQYTASSSSPFQISYRYTSQSKSFASCTAGRFRVRVW